MIDLLAEALAGPDPDQPVPSKAWRAAMLVRACRLVSLKFGDPELRPDRIAGELGISTRTLHRIFAEHGKSVMHLRNGLTALRSCWPHRMRGTAALPKSLLSCGFNDLSHFGRAFAERMGVTPSQWRKALI